VIRGPLLLAIALGGCGFSVAATGGAGDSAPEDAAIDAPIDAAPDQFVAIPACMTSMDYSPGPDGHRYRKQSATRYDGAIDTCTADGAHLAVIDTMDENAFALMFAGEDVWIGFDDLTTEGTFTWVTGAPQGFTGWTGSEPNDSGTEDCTYLRSPDGSWNDTECGDTRVSLCECELGYTPPTTPACRTMTSGFTEIDGRRYVIHDTSEVTWAAAKTACEAIGAHLSVFSDLDEANHVDDEFFGDSWIGLSDLATEGTWTWVNGSTDAFRDWSVVAPHTGDTERNCAIVNLDWFDIECTATREYSCECDPLPP
jgi:hypothetical protein